MPATSVPNIVVYVAHDLGRFASPYGVETVQTPTLERLAAEGAVFENHFTTAPQCSPARAGIFTGRHPHSTGVLGLTGNWSGWALTEDTQHLAALLGRQGYESLIIGTAHEAASTEAQLELCGFDHTEHHWCWAADQVGERLGGWLDGRADAQRPFFAEIGTIEVHHPFLFRDIQPDNAGGVTVPPPLVAGPETEKFFAEVQGCARCWDRGLADVLQVLEERGLDEDTLVIATTDHGLPVPRAKCTLYDPGLASLLLLRYPRGVAAGQRHDCLVSNVDLVPTILDAVGAEHPADLHGRSFWPLLQGEAYEEREEVFGEKTYHTQYDPMRCIRTRDYKLIYNFEAITHEHCCRDCMQDGIYVENRHLRSVERQGMGEAVELYDLRTDPLELTNLAEKPAYAGVRRDLEARLRRWMEETGDPLLRGPVAAPSFHARLAALGTGGAES